MDIILNPPRISSSLSPVDTSGMMEYWTGPRRDFAFPSHSASFDSKLDTDLYTFFKYVSWMSLV